MNLCTILCLSIVFAFGLVISSSTENVEELEHRRNILRNMTKEAWNGYVKYAWGKSALRPISKEAGWVGNDGQTILAAMGTLWLMGLRQEFDQGREWIRNNFDNFSQSEQEVSVRLYMNEFVGSLLSCYALTNDTMFRDKAFEIARALQPAFDNQTGIPSVKLIPKTGRRVFSYVTDLIDIGGTVLETRYLHSLAPEQFPDRTNQWRHFLAELSRNDDPNQVLATDVEYSVHWVNRVRSLTSSRTQPLYANLVKAYAQSNGSDLDGLHLYVKAIELGEQSQLITQSNKSRLTFIRNYWNSSKTFDDFMEYEGCNYGAIFWLAANSLQTVLQNNQTFNTKTNEQLNQTIVKYLNLASEITETCHLGANKTATKLPLRGMFFTDKEEAENLQRSRIFRKYFFDSGLEESYLVLWRATKDEKYRDYAWELVQAIKRHARVGDGDGFGSIQDVNLDNSSTLIDHQPPEMLSRVFKFLYLIFSEDSILPLDQWVFTPLGHSLPICGMNEAYPKCGLFQFEF